MKRITVVACLLAFVCASSVEAQYKAKRINKAIELLEQGQPIYYSGGRGGFDEGAKTAQTYADYINYELEHGAFDMTELRQFMLGLVKGGPTKSGHRTPAVIVTLPVTGLDEITMRTNVWVIQQVLATGVHGILLCHARVPEAARVLVEATRYPFAPKAAGLAEGLRGSGSQGFASQVWGIPAGEYLKKADVWPLNPAGEILLGLKIEDRHALANSEKSTKVPGIGFAEWGPGDMAWSLGIVNFGSVGKKTGGGGGGGPMAPEMLKARARVLAACKAAKIAFLNSVNENNVEEMIKEGVMVGSGGQAAADKGRKFSKREMPW